MNALSKFREKTAQNCLGRHRANQAWVINAVINSVLVNILVLKKEFIMSKQFDLSMSKTVT